MIGIRNRKARIAYMVSAFLLAILLAVVLATGCTSEREKRDAAKARVAQLLVEQSQLRRFLEVDFSGIRDDVLIATPDGFWSDRPEAVILNNGELNIPAGVSDKVRAALAQYQQQIAAVFKEFGCRTLVLTSEGSQKGLLEIRFDNTKINGTYYAQYLSYPSGTGGGSESVLAGWYYWAPPYT